MFTTLSTHVTTLSSHVHHTEFSCSQHVYTHKQIDNTPPFFHAVEKIRGGGGKETMSMYRKTK